MSYISSPAWEVVNPPDPPRSLPGMATLSSSGEGCPSSACTYSQMLSTAFGPGNFRDGEWMVFRAVMEAETTETTPLASTPPTPHVQPSSMSWCPSKQPCDVYSALRWTSLCASHAVAHPHTFKTIPTTRRWIMTGTLFAACPSCAGQRTTIIPAFEDPAHHGPFFYSR